MSSAPTIASTPDSSLSAEDIARARRLRAISALGILDRLGDPVLVRLTRLVQAITGASAAAVHIFDDAHQRRIAASGVALGDHPAADAMCHLVLEDDARIICADAVAEPRFSYSSFVTGPAPVRFYASVPLRIEGDTTIGTVCAFDTVPRALTTDQIASLEDIAELAGAHLTLFRLAGDLGREATEDCLTGVFNRVVFDDRVARALAEQREHPDAVLVAIADLDDFKSINDTHGHARGDAALQWAAARLQALVGADGVVGRIGGDEFAILLRGQAADGLLADIAAAGEDFDPPFQISVGAAAAEPGDDVPTLMRRADQRMYAEKGATHRRSARIWA